MPYRFLEDIAIADVAFEATGKTVKELLESAALALTNTMIKNLSKIEAKLKREFSIEAKDVEMLLFNLLQEIIFYKDSEMLLFNKFDLNIEPRKKGWKLDVVAHGEKLDMKRHELLVDVKAVTFHNFKVEETKNGWTAQVILDV